MLYKKSTSKHVTNWEFTLDNPKMYEIQPFAVDTCSWWLYMCFFYIKTLNEWMNGTFIKYTICVILMRCTITVKTQNLKSKLCYT